MRLENESINRSLADQLHDSRQRHQWLLDTYHRTVLLNQNDSQLITELKESIAREQRTRATAEMEIVSLHEVLQTAEVSRSQTERSLSRAWDTTAVLATTFRLYQLTHDDSVSNEGRERIDIATLLLEKETLRQERDDLKDTVFQERQGRKIQVDGLSENLARRQAEIAHLQQRLEMDRTQCRIPQAQAQQEGQVTLPRQRQDLQRQAILHYQQELQHRAYDQQQQDAYTRQTEHLQNAQQHVRNQQEPGSREREERNRGKSILPRDGN